MLRRWILALVIIYRTGIGSSGAYADPLKFDYRDPKEISAISLTLDSMLEPIIGYAKGISGTVTFDPANPKATTGRIAVDVASIQFTNDGYTNTARGYALNGEKYPQILFTLKQVLSVSRPTPNVYRAMVKADFFCHGITTPLTVPVTASYYPGRAEERTDGKYKGDVLVLRTHFNVSRTRQGISKGIPPRMVGDTIEVRVAVVGIHYAAGQRLPGEPVQATQHASAASDRAERWQLELEDRDNPLPVDAALDLKAPEPKILFRTAKGDLAAQSVRFYGKRLAFHVPTNPVTQAGEAEAVVENGRIRGVIGSGDRLVKFHGVRKGVNADGSRRDTDSRGYAGPGFRTLKITASGAQCSLSERMRHYRVPGLSIARIERSTVVELGYYGVTSAEAGEPIDADTLFQVGEMGSPLINIATLRLAAQGGIGLTEEANRYLKRWKIPDNELTRTRKITVADLINGTSGLTQYKFTGYRPDVLCPTLVELLQGADKSEMEPVVPRSVPGTKFTSAGINQVILQVLLMDVTGKDFPELMQELVFKPLGMPHSGYRLAPGADSRRNIAQGHYADGELMLDRFHNYPEEGASGLWTTAADYAQALCQLQRLLSGEPNAILSPDRRDLLKLVATERCVLGYIRGKGNTLYHGGDPYGYYAEPYVSSERGYGIVVLQNRMASWDLHNEIVEAVASEHHWNPPY